MNKKLEKAIRHFECMRDDNIVVLNSGFGTKKGEHNSLYKNRKMYAELAIEALEKQIAKKPVVDYVRNSYKKYKCPMCKEEVQINYDMSYCLECGQKLDWEVN